MMLMLMLMWMLLMMVMLEKVQGMVPKALIAEMKMKE
jgi:hypothetical protein